jgi:O-antigen/teichoic acid export membrane protein
MDLRTLIIGRMYSSTMLGYYNRGENFPKIIVTNLDGSLQSVMFPTFAAHQDNKKRLKEMVRRTVVTSSFLVFPAMIGLIVIAEPLVIILLTDKWLPAVPFLQIFAVSYLFLPIQTVNLQAINALGRSDLTLKLQIYKKVVGIVILLISISFGIHAIAIGAAISAFMSMLINIYPNVLLLNYSYREQFNDVIPTFAISIIMGVLVYSLRFLLLGEIGTIMLQVTLGIFIYILLAIIMKLDSFKYITNIIMGILSRKRG